MNLRKDHCRNLQKQRDPRTRSQTPPRKGLPRSYPRRGGGPPRRRKGELPRNTKYGGRTPKAITNPGADCAKDHEQKRFPSLPVPGRHGGVASFLRNRTTLGNGYLGSRIDEERSEMRYLV